MGDDAFIYLQRVYTIVQEETRVRVDLRLAQPCALPGRIVPRTGRSGGRRTRMCFRAVRPAIACRRQWQPSLPGSPFELSSPTGHPGTRSALSAARGARESWFERRTGASVARCIATFPGSTNGIMVENGQVPMDTEVFRPSEGRLPWSGGDRGSHTLRLRSRRKHGSGVSVEARDPGHLAPNDQLPIRVRVARPPLAEWPRIG